MKKTAGKWKKYIAEKLEAARHESRRRSLRVYDMMEPGYLYAQGKKYLNLSSNDYLGLAKDFQTLEEAKVLGEIVPPGVASSRLITGTLPIHDELEKVLAQWKGTESALVFPSGYQTNVGLLTTLLGRGDAVFCDRLNHASILDGCLASGAALHRYRHNDLDDLEQLLKAKRTKKRLIVTDGVFSMDGDLAPLPELNALAKRYDALLMVDEAHATGVLGERGAGSWSHFGLKWEEHVILMGTLSKAIGGQGGFVCAARAVIEMLINYCRPFIYTTALSPLLAGLAHFNISRIQEDDYLREALHRHIRRVRAAFREHGIEMRDDPTPILPVRVGESADVIAVAETLEAQEVIAVGIRPPTVPEGTARLRISLSAAHQPEDLLQAVHLIAETVSSIREGGARSSTGSQGEATGP